MEEIWKFICIVFFFMLFSSIANILFLFPSLFLFLFLITLRFNLKNYKSEIYFVLL